MIRIQNLSKTFGGEHALKNINLDIPAGSVVALIGPSGAGKSTLLRCINLLERPESGSIRVGDLTLDYRHIHQHDMYRLRRKMAMVFQSFNLFAHKTALGNVEEGLVVVQKMPRREARDLARRHLEKVGLADKLNAYPSELSGGQQQRVAIARAVAMHPEVILFDEPTSALDPELVQEVLASIRTVAAEGNTLVVVTHELSFARELASQVVFLDGGTIVEAADAATFFAHPQSERAAAFLNQYFSDYTFSI